MSAQADIGTVRRELEEKLSASEKSLKLREQMESSWRSGDDASWEAAAALHPSTAGKVMKRMGRIREAGRQGRIADKIRAETRATKEALAALSRLEEERTRIVNAVEEVRDGWIIEYGKLDGFRENFPLCFAVLEHSQQPEKEDKQP